MENEDPEVALADLKNTEFYFRQNFRSHIVTAIVVLQLAGATGLPDDEVIFHAKELHVWAGLASENRVWVLIKLDQSLMVKFYARKASPEQYKIPALLESFLF